MTDKAALETLLERVKSALEACPTCQGSGEVMAGTLPWSQREEGAFAACPDCKGTGAALEAQK